VDQAVAQDRAAPAGFPQPDPLAGTKKIFVRVLRGRSLLTARRTFRIWVSRSDRGHSCDRGRFMSVRIRVRPTDRSRRATRQMAGPCNLHQLDARCARALSRCVAAVAASCHSQPTATTTNAHERRSSGRPVCFVVESREFGAPRRSPRGRERSAVRPYRRSGGCSVSLAGVGPGLCSAAAIGRACAPAWAATPVRLVSEDVIDICWRQCCRVATRRRARHRVGKHRVVPFAGPGLEALDRRVRQR
jgi:hypothetical protein